MLYLHTRSPAINHRDLKTANLLVTSQYQVKVGARWSVCVQYGTGAALGAVTGPPPTSAAVYAHQQDFSWCTLSFDSQVADFNLSRTLSSTNFMSTLCIQNPRSVVGGTRLRGSVALRSCCGSLWLHSHASGVRRKAGRAGKQLAIAMAGAQGHALDAGTATLPQCLLVHPRGGTLVHCSSAGG